MNDVAAEATAEDGGRASIGKNLLDCHPPEAQKRLREVVASETPNVCTVEKKRTRKIVFHGHRKRSGKVGGIVELVFALSKKVPHRVGD